jgi:competence protein ComEC
MSTSSNAIMRASRAWPGARVIELHWPALLAGSACVGLALANLSQDRLLPAAIAFVGLVGLALAERRWRIVALAVVLVAVGLGWGSLRLEAMAQSQLSAEIGSYARAELVVTGPARRTPWAIRVPAQVREFGRHRLREHVLLVLPVGRSPPRGAILEALVRITEPRSAENGFDERGWLARQGIHVVAKARSWSQVGRRGGVAGLGDRLRDRIEIAVGRGTAGMRRALVLGVVLGEDEGLSPRVRDDFRGAGLAHLLAVSGQNVAFIAGGIFGLGWLLRLSRVVRELLVIAAIVSYVLAVGWQPSVVRAGVAGALVSLAWLYARPRDRWHFLAVGALVLLAWAPTSLLEPGFQLSFAAVAAIFLGLPRVQSSVAGYPVPRRVAEVVGIALVCGLATAPIVLVHFDSAPVYTVPANALAAPAMPLVLGLGLLAAAADPVAPGAAAALAWLAGWAAAWLELVARLMASLPGAEIGPQAALGAVAAVAALLLGSRYVRSRAGPRGKALVVAAAGISLVVLAGAWSLRAPPTWHQPAGLRVTFLDVGQGDAVLLETASARVLVDQGPPEARVAGQLARMGVRSLSAVVLTHPQRDHIGGAAAVLRQLRVGVVLDPLLAATGPEREEAVAAARERGVPVRAIRAGSEFRAGGLVLRVLWPPDPGLAHEDPNLNATVIVASYGEIDVFLPADAESDVTAGLDLRAVEVLKVAHHGSEDPGLGEELRVLRPRIAVISAGRNNDYGHPRPGTLAALSAVSGLALYRTDQDGRVVVETDGRGLRVRTAG